MCGSFHRPSGWQLLDGPLILSSAGKDFSVFPPCQSIRRQASLHDAEVSVPTIAAYVFNLRPWHAAESDQFPQLVSMQDPLAAVRSQIPPSLNFSSGVSMSNSSVLPLLSNADDLQRPPEFLLFFLFFSFIGCGSSSRSIVVPEIETGSSKSFISHRDPLQRVVRPRHVVIPTSTPNSKDGSRCSTSAPQSDHIVFNH